MRIPRTSYNRVPSPGPRDVLPLPARPQVQFDLEIGYHQPDPEFVKLMFQLARRPQQRPDVDYLLEVRFVGPDLSTAISTLIRASVEGRLSYDPISGGLMEHSTDSIIEVKRPARFDEHLRFVICQQPLNSSGSSPTKFFRADRPTFWRRLSYPLTMTRRIFRSSLTAKSRPKA